VKQSQRKGKAVSNAISRQNQKHEQVKEMAGVTKLKYIFISRDESEELQKIGIRNRGEKRGNNCNGRWNIT
jgi:hypothetical protein